VKKYLALIVSLVFVLGFAASAFAVQAEIPADTKAVIAKGTTQVTIGGELRFRGEVRNNTADFLNSKNDHDQYYDMRIRLSIEAKVTPNTTGFIMLDSGNENDKDNVTWGDYSNYGEKTGAKGLYKVGNTQKGDVRILQAWLQHQGSGLLGIPAFIKVGHMPIKLGNGLFLDHTYFGDDAILLGIEPIKNMNVILHTIKFREYNSTTMPLYLNEDADAYGLIFSYAFDKASSISADVTYVNHQNLGQTANGVPASTPTINLWNVGLRGNTEFSGFGLLEDVEFQFGKVKNFGNEPKFKGYAGWLGAYYKVNPVKIYLDFAYGSGGNSDDTDIKTFMTTQGQEKHYTYVYEYRTKGAAGEQYGGIANTWFVRLGANADLTKKLNGDLSVYYLSAVKDYFGAPVYSGGTKTDSKDIGIEVDATLTYQIDKNLKCWIEGGYLFAGDYWKTAITKTTDKNDAFAARIGIQVNF
jgi:hypothetical protein